jgi:hypothetical protein
VTYFHVVFTVPHVLNPLFLGNHRQAYHLLFTVVAETLKEVALNPQNLGARIGFTALLHTWTQQLIYHPHVHCLVSGGGLSPDRERWVSSGAEFFVHVKRLSALLRGKLLKRFENAINEHRIDLDTDDPHSLLRQAAAKKKWVVYAKRPLCGPNQVLEYLGRYTHRIGISNSRILEMSNGKVRFSYRDRSDEDRLKTMELEAVEFIRRFLLHILPKGFVRVRHYGLLANAIRQGSLSRCTELLEVDLSQLDRPGDVVGDDHVDNEHPGVATKDTGACPRCRDGRLTFKELIPRVPTKWASPGRATSP